MASDLAEPIDEVLSQLEQDGEIESWITDLEDAEDGGESVPVTAYELTRRGVDVLEDWRFDQWQYERERKDREP